VTASTKEGLVEPWDRRRNWAAIAAFTLIGVLTIAEMVDEGASAWDWLVIAVCTIFIVQAYTRLQR
jgi:uncharacterized membrane protein YobD (UPF0266 family)